MSYNWERAPYPWERYSSQIARLLVMLAVVGAGAMAATALASFSY
jgi:hypothetical protein